MPARMSLVARTQAEKPWGDVRVVGSRRGPLPPSPAPTQNDSRTLVMSPGTPKLRRSYLVSQQLERLPRHAAAVRGTDRAILDGRRAPVPGRISSSTGRAFVDRVFPVLQRRSGPS